MYRRDMVRGVSVNEKPSDMARTNKFSENSVALRLRTRCENVYASPGQEGGQAARDRRRHMPTLAEVRWGRSLPFEDSGLSMV
jgi:hypothetical protein